MWSLCVGKVKSSKHTYVRIDVLNTIFYHCFCMYVYIYRYDILVLPPSFPYGGMENPCLTFVTPTLLAGDRSLANVVAHEIAHSWMGNLVTNITWEHFWMNGNLYTFIHTYIYMCVCVCIYMCMCICMYI